jgi:hypothetical protein
VALIRERAILTEPQALVGDVSAKFLRIEECRVISATDPHDHILGFLDRNRQFTFDQLLSYTQEAEWTAFQTHYFLEILVAPGIELRPWISNQELWPLDHRGSLHALTCLLLYGRIARSVVQ